ncbi:MAG: exodeoxyribonuclease VII small subunit [Cardiobacteriaceae bacterium]|nr:exodeoxyribonuclease VII small subunit [Cardiobacteriaceae bacterium]
MNYEHNLRQLEHIIAQLERGELPLEEALQTYEQGIALLRSCQSQLKQAEQRILVLQNASLEPYPQSALSQNPTSNPEPTTKKSRSKSPPTPSLLSTDDHLPF